MRRLIIAAMLVVASVSQAQAPDPARIQAVWDAVNERMARQTDAWFHDGDYPRLVNLLRFHVAFEPADYEIATNLGWMLENVELEDEALVVYIQLRTQNLGDPDCAWPEANFYFKKKAFAKIPPILEPTIKDHDPHANNYRTLAHAYEKLEMLNDAKRVWDQYLSKHPDDTAAKANLNKVLKRLSGGATGKK